MKFKLSVVIFLCQKSVVRNELKSKYTTLKKALHVFVNLSIGYNSSLEDIIILAK